MERSCFESHWHHSETGWQKWKAWSWGAKCALACEMEGWVAGSWGRHEGRGSGGDGSAHGRTGYRGGAESQACRVAAKPTVMLATGIGCCGPQVVLVCTSKGQAVNMKTQLIFPLHLSHLSPLLHHFFSLALRLSFSSASHERHIQGAAESLSSGGETACLQGCHDKVQERPERGEERDRSAEERWPAV